ncbi:MAG TPA: DNA polymerase III subunit delta [Candidatus Moranbacteria bacterium]|nr:DNA polymerase III subunit delta [Candidatus Moranbacteria bacterium]HRZ33505.1 DNA polymerase III subunit delta [Candidatus Moranbacteria bacterium]
MFIFLYGADTFRSLEKLSALKNKYLEKNSSGTDLSVLDYDNASAIKNLSDILSAQGLFSTKQLIIVKNILLSGSIEKQKDVLEFLKSRDELENDNDAIIVFFEKDSPKKNSSLFKFLSAHAKSQEFSPYDGAHLANWVLAYAKKISSDVSFSRNALNMLLAATGNDLYVLSNEITKLINYKGSGIIKEEDIELLVKSKIDSTIFETIEALCSGDKNRALALLHEQLEKGEDIFYILSMYAYQLRTILKIGDFLWQGISNTYDIAKTSKLHPYVVRKTLPQAKVLGEKKAKQIFCDLAQIDQDAKIGKIDPVLALDIFIVSL